MACTVAELPPGARITDYISLGVLPKTFPVSSIGAVLSKTGSAAKWLSTELFPAAKRKALHQAALGEILVERVVCSRNRRNPHAVKRKMSNFPIRSRHCKPLPPINIQKTIGILK